MSGEPELAVVAAKWLAAILQCPELEQLKVAEDDEARKNHKKLTDFLWLLAVMETVGAATIQRNATRNIGIAEIRISNMSMCNSLITDHLTDALENYRRKRKKTHTEGKKSANMDPMDLVGKTLQKLGFRPTCDTKNNCALTGWRHYPTMIQDKFSQPETTEDGVFKEEEEKIMKILTNTAKPYLLADFQDAGSASEKPKGVFTTRSGRTADSMSSRLDEGSTQAKRGLAADRFEHWLAQAEHDEPGQKTKEWPPPEPEDIKGGKQIVECNYCKKKHVVTQALCSWVWDHVPEVREHKRPSQFYCLNPMEIQTFERGNHFDGCKSLPGK